MKNTIVTLTLLFSVLLSNAQFYSDFSIQPPSSSTACDGWLSLFMGGGTSPYTTVWNGSISDTMTGTGSYDTLWNVCSGIYFVDGYDAAGDSVHYDFILSNPSTTFGTQPSSTDSIVHLYVENCAIDYSAPVNDVFLNWTDFYGANSFDPDTLVSYWSVVQSPDTIVAVDTNYGYYPTVANLVLDAAIFCPDSVVKAPISVTGPIIHVTTSVNGQTLSVHEVNNGNKLDVFPNPFKDEIILRSEGLIRSYAIYNLAGQLMASKSGLEMKTIEVTTTSNLSPGVYFISVETEREKRVLRLIKE